MNTSVFEKATKNFSPQQMEFLDELFSKNRSTDEIMKSLELLGVPLTLSDGSLRPFIDIIRDASKHWAEKI